MVEGEWDKLETTLNGNECMCQGKNATIKKTTCTMGYSDETETFLDLEISPTDAWSTDPIFCNSTSLSKTDNNAVVGNGAKGWLWDCFLRYAAFFCVVHWILCFSGAHIYANQLSHSPFPLIQKPEKAFCRKLFGCVLLSEAALYVSKILLSYIRHVYQKPLVGGVCYV